MSYPPVLSYLHIQHILNVFFLGHDMLKWQALYTGKNVNLLFGPSQAFVSSEDTAAIVEDFMPFITACLHGLGV